MSSYSALTIPASVRSVIRQDGAVLMETDSGLMFSLNEVGSFIWEELSNYSDPRDISAAIAQRYGISLGEAQRDIDAFLVELKRSRLVTSG